MIPSPDPDGLTDRERALVERGARLEAIRRIRERTGCGLSEAVRAADAAESAGAAGTRELPGALLDAAFDLLDLAPSSDPPERLRRHVPGTSRADAVEALRRARALDAAAYDLCDRLRDERPGPREDDPSGRIAAALAGSQPGFSRETYAKAYGRGMLASR